MKGDCKVGSYMVGVPQNNVVEKGYNRKIQQYLDTLDESMVFWSNPGWKESEINDWGNCSYQKFHQLLQPSVEMLLSNLSGAEQLSTKHC